MISLLQIAVWMAFFIGIYIATFWLLTFLEFFEKQRNETKKFPKVTIAIPAYNEEKGIIDTINSVFDIDYPKEFMELIIVNDGSTDNTKKIVSDIISKSKILDIKLINQKSNLRYII